MSVHRKQFGANVAATVLAAITLAACGAADENPVPPGATITLSSSAYEWEIAPVDDPCLVYPDYYNDHLVNIAVLSSSNLPVGDVNVHLTLDLSDATFSGTPVMGLYDDLNGNGAREPEELVSTDGSGAYTVKTNQYDGTKAIWVRVNLSCPYKGTLSAFSGAASTSMEISVTERAEEAP